MRPCPSPMPLSELLPELHLSAPLASLAVQGMSNDSRRVQPGDLFLACQGARHDGAAFVNQAAAAGAVAVLCDRKLADPVLPLLVVPDLAERTAELASRFYGAPSRQLYCTGVTGTNGKTSVSHFIARALTALEGSAALVGTNGYGFPGALADTTHTTPDSLRLQQMLATLGSEGARSVTLEVSSHALEQGRVAGLEFDQGVFTNLTRDHLDYHGTMEEYGAAKARLFLDSDLDQAVINLDDPFGARLAERLEGRYPVLGYGFSAKAALRALDCEASAQGLRARIATPWGELNLQTSLLGRFNLYNLLATLGVLAGRGHSLETIGAALSQLEGVPGRMQPLQRAGAPLVVVDYAHTPDALEKALRALREHQPGALWCVVGCGGDRDRGKRPLMAAMAEQLADHLVLTSDNPRGEAPERILEEMHAGLSGEKKVRTLVEREAAITLAVTHAAPGDIVLVAGKGHENYQEIEGVRHPFSDVEVVEAALTARGGGRA
ncbi:UDP-N-acetylmuramoyl-L-alanyl-D-glutamate--2,6-diaminopimelate ligase [Motiliproteus sp. SC1-56]|uniref:UDP-N-acetylmuramoyl-L-alanyl-D-glutamate--2, 6-diaminopimelate ligase n=1 Tax=Motiliproteus sp. SC1-56 TaxID=2799565 RepID=UPI001F5D8AB8|nr:UDP-N-acetylmuramoyl-L-alanyl-D-glutamate--2,6-diaminopimelate ligase [Motiliproteus sp. SC1-56]